MQSSFRVALVLVLAPAACSKRDSLNEKGDPTGRNVPSREVALEIESAGSFGMGFSDTETITARVTYVDDGSPAGDRTVEFGISGTAGGSTLSSSEVTTGANGRASVQVRSGATRTTFNVVVTTPQAEGAGEDPRETVAVDVDGVYRGKLQTKYSYTGPIVIKELITRIHQGTLDCGAVAWPAQPAGVATQTATATTATLTFDNLPEETIYTVTVSALGIAGQQVATGCKQAPAIIGKSTVVVTVPVTLRPTQMTGEYDFGAVLHFDEALPGNAGEVVSDLESFFTDPADVLGYELTWAIADMMGSDPNDVNAAISAAWVLYALAQDPALDVDVDNDGEMVDDAITYFVLDNMPGWVGDAFTIGGDLTGMLTDFHTGGTMSITEATDAGALTGHWDFHDFIFRWRVTEEACDFTNTCCGRHTYTGEEMGLTPFGADFTGTATLARTAPRLEYDLAIPAHRIDLQYGAMALFLLEQLILPELTGEASTACAIESFFGCDGSSSNFVCGSPSLNGDICGCERAGYWLSDMLGGAVTPELGEVACGWGVQGGAAYVENLLLSLTWDGAEDSYLSMALTGTMADADKNNTTDELLADAAGDLTIGGDSAPFTGIVRGDIERQSCIADAGCEAYEACVPKQNLLDECTGRFVCVQGFGDKTAGQACSTNAQCWSNVCYATTHKCVEVCAEDSDCGGTLGCGDQAINLALSTELSVPVHACGL